MAWSGMKAHAGCMAWSGMKAHADCMASNCVQTHGISMVGHMWREGVQQLPRKPSPSHSTYGWGSGPCLLHRP
eukprot:21216-Chlamydomonas_euryale.AAC.3